MSNIEYYKEKIKQAEKDLRCADNMKQYYANKRKQKICTVIAFIFWYLMGIQTALILTL